jgi:hypothetical protein
VVSPEIEQVIVECLGETEDLGDRSGMESEILAFRLLFTDPDLPNNKQQGNETYEKL